MVMIIVTGGAGFIGSAFVWKLNEMGEDNLLIVDRLGESEKWKNLVNRRFTDYLPKERFIDDLENGRFDGSVRALIHMGACSSTTEKDASYLMENNTAYTRRLAEWSLRREIRFIYASSAATYGDGRMGFNDDEASIGALKPLNMYGYSKQLFDTLAIRNRWTEKMVGLRFFNVYGPNEYHKDDMSSMLFKSHGQIVEKGRVRLFKSHRPDYGDGEQLRDFIYVKDVVEVMAHLLEREDVNGIFNLGTGQARNWNDLVGAVFSALGREPQVDYIDMPEALRGKYQYFTQAEMGKLKASGIPLKFHTLEEGARDYVVNYLESDDPYL